MANQIKETKAKGTIVGTLEQLSLELKTGLKGTDKNGKDFTYDLIQGTGQNGVGMVVDGIGVTVRVQSEWNSEKSNDKNFKAITTIMNEYVDKIKAAELTKKNADVAKAQGLTEYETVVADTINVTCNYEFNEFANRDKTDTTQTTKISYDKASRVSADTEHKNEFYLENACIRSIVPIIRNEEETGEYKLNVVGFNYKGEIGFYSFTVKDMEETYEGFTDDAVEAFAPASTARISFVIKNITVGEKKKPKSSGKSFGKRVEVVEGYTIPVPYVIGGDVLDEEDVNCYDINDIKAAVLLHDNETKAEILKKAKENEAKKANQPKSNGGGLKGSGAAPKKATLGKQAQVTAEDDCSDLPF